MLASLLRLRLLAFVISLFCALNAVAFVAIGVVRAVAGYVGLVHGPPWEGAHAPGVELAKSIDSFLLAMVFFVFSIGVTTLFVARPDSRMLENIPEWMQMKSLSQLKFMLWEAIMATLVVTSVEGFAVSTGELTWTVLLVPGAVLILSLGYFLSRRAH